MRRTALFLLGAWLAAACAAASPAADSRLPAEVIRRTGGAGSLDARLKWALEDAAKAGAGRMVWVGYSIRLLMGEDQTVGSSGDGWQRNGLTIAEILAGKSHQDVIAGQGGDVRRTAREVLEKLERPAKPEKKVEKDLAIFLSYESGRTASLRDVDLSNVDRCFDFKGRSLYWLGEADGAESFGVMKALYARAEAAKAKEGLLAAAGLHGNPRLAVPFLASVLSGGEAEELRKDAAFWIGQQNDAEGLRTLVRAAESDRSREVREGAVFSISQVKIPEAADELIALARGDDHVDVRKQAIFWLSQIASEKAAPALEEFARKDGEPDIQEQAVFALSQLPENQGLEPLIKLAKTHPDPRVRKKAIFWLGESRDPRALEALVDIIKGK
jgi:hypothetical protein